MIAPLLLAASLAFTQKDAAFAFETAKALVGECTPRDAGTAGGERAANWLYDRIRRTGARVRRDVFTAPTPEGESRFANLCAEFGSNPTNGWVVLLSHYDTKSGCPGANDGASTSGLLVALANRLARTEEPVGNLLLVWTDAEECRGERYAENDGFQGSRRAVAELRKTKRRVRAAICLDMLGDRDLAITVPANGTPSLARLARDAARRIGEPELVRLSESRMKDDHVAFLAAGYPAIDLIDFAYGPDNGWWHTKDDTVDKLSEKSLYRSGRLVCEMLRLLR